MFRRCVVGYARRMPTACFAPDLANSDGVRRFVEEELRRGPVSEDTMFRAQLLATELVTNAVRHAGSGVELTVALDEGRVRIQARDGSSAKPASPPADPETRHRGLFLLEDLSEEWGVELEGHTGKIVWCEVAAT